MLCESIEFLSVLCSVSIALTTCYSLHSAYICLDCTQFVLLADTCMFSCSSAVILEKWKQWEVAEDFSLRQSDAVSLGEHSQHSARQTSKISHKISLICNNSVTIQNLWFFRRNF